MRDFFRIERDTMGDMQVPASALYGPRAAATLNGRMEFSGYARQVEAACERIEAAGWTAGSFNLASGRRT